MALRKQKHDQDENGEKFSADDVVEAIHCFAMHLPSLGAPVVLNEGQRLRGNHEAVQLNPQFFALAGAPHDEIAAQRHALYATERPPELEIVRTRIAPPLRDEDAVVPCGRVIGVPEGKRIAKTDPAVLAQPDAFVAVAADGLTRDNSYVALATMTNTTDAGTRTIWHGQWVAKDDPFVTMHPHQFGMLPETALTDASW